MDKSKELVENKKENLDEENLTFREYVSVIKLMLDRAFRADAPEVFGLVVVFVLTSLQPLLRAYILKVFIDSVVSAEVLEPSRLFSLLGILGLSFLAGPFLTNLEDYFNENIRDKLNRLITKEFSEKLASLDFPHFEDPKLYDLVSKVGIDVYYRPIFFLQHLLGSFSEIISIVANALVVSQVHPALIPIITITTLPTYVVNTKHSIQAYSVFNFRSPYWSKASYFKNLLSDPWGAIELKIYKLSSYLIKKYLKIHDLFIKENKDIRKGRLSAISFTSIIDQLGMLTGIAYLAVQTVNQLFSVGSFTFYYAAINKLNSSSTKLLERVNKGREHAQYMYLYKKFLDLELALEYPDKGIKLSPKKLHKIEFKNVWFKYPGSDNWVFKNFSMEILPGKQIALVGDNGAGKTTLIKLLLRFFDPNKGEILIDGHNLKELDIEAWHKNVGVLFQEYKKYALTVKENIGFGDIKNLSNMKLIKAAAKKSTADIFINKLKKKYDQFVGRVFEGSVGISGGQWQKLALARSFMRNAPITILDEPTSSLDVKTEAEVFNRLNKWMSDKTVIFVSHRFSTVKNADKIFVIDKGKITESGSHTELVAKKGVYAKLYKLQADAYKD